MRLFVALDVPKEVCDYLVSLQGLFPDVAGFVFPKSFHLTLKFLGDVSFERLEAIKKKLAGVEFQSFSLSLSKLGVFSSFNHVNVVWVGVVPEEPVIGLQKKISLALKDFVPVDDDFVPHLTLARVKFVKDKASLVSFIKSLHVKQLSFVVSGFRLYSSVLTPEGPVYNVEAVFPF